MRFKDGDKVRIIKPLGIVYDKGYEDSTTTANQQWIDSMDYCDGKEVTLEKFDDKGGWRGRVDDGGKHWFLEDWLQPIGVHVDGNTSDAYDRAMSIL